MHTGPEIPELVFRGGRIVDPVRKVDGVGDLAVAGGRIVDQAGPDAVPFDASGLIVCPGLVDIHVHLREPGYEHKEDIQTGCAAAAAGGFTTVACMPNTNPALDTPDVIRQVRKRAEEVGNCRVLVVGAITKGRAGRELTDFAALQAAGAVAFSDDGDGVEDAGLMREALEQAAAVQAVLVQHCEFQSLAAGGCMHQGPTSGTLGLPGLDPRAEVAMIERDLDLVRKTGARYHIAHISTAEGVELLRAGKQDNLPVTAEICPHHLLLTDESCRDADPAFKMSPPLRSGTDVDACLEALLDGTIDCVVTDHAPHTDSEKAVGFERAPFGIVGLETALGLLSTEFTAAGRMDWAGLVTRLTANPLRVLGLETPSLAGSAVADVCLIDPTANWKIDPRTFASRSRNTPFAGWEVTGRPVATLVDGKISFLHSAYRRRLAV